MGFLRFNINIPSGTKFNEHEDTRGTCLCRCLPGLNSTEHALLRTAREFGKKTILPNIALIQLIKISV